MSKKENEGKSIVFGEPEYLEIPHIEVDVKYLVHFRPSSDWKGMGYGFDWMRVGDYKEILEKAGADPRYAQGDVPYEKLVTRQFSSFPEGFDTSIPWQRVEEEHVVTPDDFSRNFTFYQDMIAKQGLDNLERREYDCFKVKMTGQIYYSSWLSLYPPCPPDAIDCQWNSEAKLSLIIEVLTERTAETPPLELKFWPPNKNIEIEILKKEEIAQLPKGRHILPDAMIVRCLQEFGTKQMIEARLDRTVAGRLYIYPNGKEYRKTANILPVLVQSKKEEENSTDIEQIQNEASEYLRQAMVELIDARTLLGGDKNYLELDIYEYENEEHEKIFQPRTDVTKETDGSYKYVVANMDVKKKGGLMATIQTEYEDSEGNRDYSKVGRSMPGLETVLNAIVAEKLSKLGIKSDDYIKMYYLDQEIYSKKIILDNETGKLKEVRYEGLAGAYATGKSAVYMGPNDTSPTVIAHELLHSMGLPHPFVSKSRQSRLVFNDTQTSYTREIYDQHPNAKYTFVALETDNIMDYSDTRILKIAPLKKGDEYFNEEKNNWDTMPEDGQGLIQSETPVYSTWHWQWELVAQNIDTNGIINEDSHE